MKDISEAHIRELNVPALIERLMQAAPLASDILSAQQGSSIDDLRRRADTVLASEDPLQDVEAAIKALGYGGDVTSALITYIAMTSRLLEKRHGAMPGHLVLLGSASSGKSFTVQTDLRLLPPEAYHVLDASSPRALIYDSADLRHRVVVFSEADSLPAGEDNPAASAIRNLLQDGHLHYTVTVRDPDTGDWSVRDVNKQGPTVLITTSTKRLGDQLESRLFILEVPDDQKQIRAALTAQAAIELHGASEPPDALIAYQSLLQNNAPWHVYVPFADKLAEAIGKSPAAPRILRDYARLIAFTKAVAIMRHSSRVRDDQGRIVATLADYATVFKLTYEMYAGSVTGASRKIRAAISAVRDLGGHVNVTQVAAHLGINKMAAGRRITAAEKNGWLVNVSQQENLKDLVLGESLPAESGLPTSESLGFEEDSEACNSVTLETDGYIHPTSISSNGHKNIGDIHPSVTDVTPLHDTENLVEVPKGTILFAGVYKVKDGRTYANGSLPK